MDGSPKWGCTKFSEGNLKTCLLTASLQKKSFETDLTVVRNTGPFPISNDEKLQFSTVPL